MKIKDEILESANELSDDFTEKVNSHWKQKSPRPRQLRFLKDLASQLNVSPEKIREFLEMKPTRGQVANLISELKDRRERLFFSQMR